MAIIKLNRESFWNFWQKKESQELILETAIANCGGDMSMVDDILQDVFAKIWNKLEKDNITIEYSLRAYVRTSIYHKAMDYHRKKRELPISDHLKEKLKRESFEIDDIETTELLKILLKDFSEDNEKIFRLRIMGYEYEEIAAEIDSTPHSVKARLSRIKKQIRNKLGSTDYLISIFIMLFFSI